MQDGQDGHLVKMHGEDGTLHKSLRRLEWESVRPRLQTLSSPEQLGLGPPDTGEWSPEELARQQRPCVDWHLAAGARTGWRRQHESSYGWSMEGGH